jgi:uncharacterized phiE125 gp8 family phage protein
VQTADVWQGLALVTPPAFEPYTLEQAKAQLRVEHATDDVLIAALLSAAREAVELHTGKALYKQRWRLTLARFPRFYTYPYPPLVPPSSWMRDGWRPPSVELPMPPTLSIASVTYVDANGDSQVMSSGDYRVVTADRTTIEPTYGTDWPETQEVGGAVQIEFWAGYTDGVVGEEAAAAGDPASAIPPSLKHAVLLWLGHLYENREATADAAVQEVPLGLSSLLGLHGQERF